MVSVNFSSLESADKTISADPTMVGVSNEPRLAEFETIKTLKEVRLPGESDSFNQSYLNAPDEDEDDEEEEEDDMSESLITAAQTAFLQDLDKHAEHLFPETADDEQKMTNLKYFIEQQSDMTKSNLGKPGQFGQTILHGVLLQKASKFNSTGRYLFKCMMEEHRDLYKNLFKRDSILHTAAQKKWVNFIQNFVCTYPQAAADILQNTQDGYKLLRQIMPSVAHCADPRFLELFSDKNRKTVHKRPHKCCCPKCPLSGTTEMITVSDIKKSSTLDVSRIGDSLTQRLESNENGNTVLHLAAQYNPRDVTSQLEMIRKVFEWCPQALEKSNKVGHSPYRHYLHTYEKHAPDKKEEGKDALPWSDVIADYLKDKIMHLTDRDLILRLLHGDDGAKPGTEKEIHLDLCEIENATYTVSKDSLEKFLKTLEFEDILQYVQIPRHPFSSNSNTAVPQDEAMEDTDKAGVGVGRQDFKFIFDILKDKGIQKIVKLIVKDDELYPHSDDVIEELQYFKIEEWDWNKIDLSSVVLRKAAPLVRKVHLWSSGNHSVLRDWSSCDGLNRLPHLENVHVTIRWMVESKSTTEKYAKDFEDRMVANCPQLAANQPVVKVEKMTSGINKIWPWTSDQMTTNAWLENMTQFVEFITNIPKTVQPKKEVRVAILDDGIDLIQAGLDRCIGCSFYTETLEDFTRINPYYFSSTGHGTLMATLVQKICPKAQLYVARVGQGRSPTGILQPTAPSAANAIRWAIRQQVHIISMSWTIPDPPTDKHTDLEDAIKAAKKANILMFGSASDQGRNNTFTPYPANCKEHGVICIGAAGDSGHSEARAEKEADYFFPGGTRGIELPLPQVRSDEKPQPLPGSSVATALATGLTALIMYCVEISKYGIPEDGYSYRDKLQDYTMIKQIFTDLASGEGGHFIPVQKFFKAELAGEIWEINGKNELDKAVGRIIRKCIDDKDGFAV